MRGRSWPAGAAGCGRRVSASTRPIWRPVTPRPGTGCTRRCSRATTEIANPEGWLALVTYRRAIDEHRARLRAPGPSSRRRRDTTRAARSGAGAPERDLAGELDDRARLRQLMEGLRGRLSPRERQAAALCYLQGLSRADAAARMGITEARMRKLMEGSRRGLAGRGRQGGRAPRDDPRGLLLRRAVLADARVRVRHPRPRGRALRARGAHQRECPSCRAYVLSLRGLASVLPPLPLPWVLGAGVAAGAGRRGWSECHGRWNGRRSGREHHRGRSWDRGRVWARRRSRCGRRNRLGVGAGVWRGAGGGWLVAGGGIGAKLAVGCLVAVGVGAGCVALTVAPILPSHPHPHRRNVAHTSYSSSPIADEALMSSSPVGAQLTCGGTSSARAGATKTASNTGASDASTLTPAAKASREFGLEQPTHQTTAVAQQSAHTARVASAEGGGSGEHASTSGGSSAGSTTSSSLELVRRGRLVK